MRSRSRHRSPTTFSRKSAPSTVWIWSRSICSVAASSAFPDTWNSGSFSRRLAHTHTRDNFRFDIFIFSYMSAFPFQEILRTALGRNLRGTLWLDAQRYRSPIFVHFRVSLSTTYSWSLFFLIMRIPGMHGKCQACAKDLWGRQFLRNSVYDNFRGERLY